MKALYSFIQERALLICIFFGVSPDMPSFMQHYVGYEEAIYATWALLAASVALFALCFWWLKASWILPKPANMMAATFASVLGLMISISALLGMYGFGTGLYLLWRELPAHIVQGLMIVALLLQVLEISPFAKKGEK